MMKNIIIILILFYINCSTSDNSKFRLSDKPKFRVEEFSGKKFSECFPDQADSIFSTNALVWNLGIITLLNTTNDTIWVLAEKKYNNLFYGPSHVKSYKGSIMIEESIGNRFADTTVKITPNTNQCFLTFFINPKQGYSKELQFGYLKDTTNMALLYEWVKIEGFKN